MGKYAAVGLEHGDSALAMVDEEDGAGGSAEEQRLASREEVRVTGLDDRRAMKNMGIAVGGSRAPTEVSHRRWLAIGALVLFMVGLLAIIIGESSFSDDPAGMDSSLVRADARRDVFLVTFSFDGAPLTWAQADVVKSEDFAREALDAIADVPFKDFSVEFRIVSLQDQVTLACIEEENRHIQVDSHGCSDEQAKVITEIASVDVERCADDSTSALRNAIKCNKENRDEALVLYWQRIFASAVQGKSFSSRCCDYDQVLINLDKHATLQMCSANFTSAGDSKVHFLRYFGLEDTPSCNEELCGCVCFADRLGARRSNGLLADSNEGCPKVPDEVTAEACAHISRFGDSPRCGDLGQLAASHAGVFKSNHIDIGSNPRCYGQFEA